MRSQLQLLNSVIIAKCSHKSRVSKLSMAMFQNKALEKQALSQDKAIGHSFLTSALEIRTTISTTMHHLSHSENEGKN